MDLNSAMFTAQSMARGLDINPGAENMAKNVRKAEKDGRHSSESKHSELAKAKIAAGLTGKGAKLDKLA